MWILLIPLFVAMAIFWAFMAYVAWAAFVTLRRGHYVQLIVWLAILAAPFLYYSSQVAEAEYIEANRTREVANFERNSMPSHYPRLLEVYGHLTTFELIVYLDQLEIDEIAIFSRHSGQRTARGRFVGLNPECRGRGAELLAHWKRRARFSYASKEDKACLRARYETVSADRSSIPAILFLTDSATTLKLPGTGYSGGNFEARIRTGTDDYLLDYWERPFIKRPAGIGPWGYAFKANTNWRNYRTPGRFNFLARALGLLPPQGKT